MWSPLRGACPHKCSYCYVKSGRCAHLYEGPLHLSERQMEQPLWTSRLQADATAMKFDRPVIFVEHRNDLWAKDVPEEIIRRVLLRCLIHDKIRYVFQTKNPARYFHFLNTMEIPEGSLLGCTIETNRDIPPTISLAPQPTARHAALMLSRLHPFITIEPVMDFDIEKFLAMICEIKPPFVNIGADSKRHHLREPSKGKLMALIGQLTGAGIEIREKHNLERLLA
jgi:hypothetical protein